MEIILERLVLIFQSDSLGDFHVKHVIDMKRPYSVFAPFPVMFARTERGVTLVFSVDCPPPACMSFSILVSLFFAVCPLLLDCGPVFLFLCRPYQYRFPILPR